MPTTAEIVGEAQRYAQDGAGLRLPGLARSTELLVYPSGRSPLVTQMTIHHANPGGQGSVKGVQIGQDALVRLIAYLYTRLALDPDTGLRSALQGAIRDGWDRGDPELLIEDVLRLVAATP